MLLARAAFAQMEVYAWALFFVNQVPKNLKVKLAVIYPLDKIIKVREPGGFADLEEKVRSYLRK